MRQGRGTRGNIDQVGDESGKLVASVEAVGPFDVAEQHVDPGQPGRFAAALAVAGDAGLALAACVGHPAKARQPVRAHHRPGLQVPTRLVLQFLDAKSVNWAQVQPIGPPVLDYLRCCPERRLAVCVTTTLAAGRLLSQIGVVHLDRAVQRLAVGALPHGL